LKECYKESYFFQKFIIVIVFYWVNKERGCEKMEEVLYNIEIHRNEENFMGKIYSDIDGVKEFENNRIDRLLRDIIFDMQLALDDELLTRANATDLTEFTDELK